MIRAEHLRKSFRGLAAVQDVSLTALDGAVTGLLGPNGAGKTTTLRMLCGLVRPDQGTVDVDNCDVVADPAQALSRLGVLTDQPGLYGRLTAREHVRYFGALHGLRGTVLERRIDRSVAMLDLHGIADRRVAGFSHGERMKVALARLLVHGPRNILLDEPTNGLDVLSTRALREIVRRLREDGACIVLSSHVMQEVSAMCDRIVVVASGRVVADGSQQDLLRKAGAASLEDAFVLLSGPSAARTDGVLA
jgi:sodium transport system ATP-binding protein